MNCLMVSMFYSFVHVSLPLYGRRRFVDIIKLTILILGYYHLLDGLTVITKFLESLRS